MLREAVYYAHVCNAQHMPLPQFCVLYVAMCFIVFSSLFFFFISCLLFCVCVLVLFILFALQVNKHKAAGFISLVFSFVFSLAAAFYNFFVFTRLEAALKGLKM